MEPFVVGGLTKTIAEYPHSIYLAADCSKPWICGASVLNQNILITAAHCLKGCDVDNPEHLIEAFAGHENLLKVGSQPECVAADLDKTNDQWLTGLLPSCGMTQADSNRFNR